MPDLRTLGPWIGLALIALVTILTIGGPGQARRDRQDAARVTDLHSLKDAVNCHARQNAGRLPDSLAEIADCGFLPLDDRVSGTPYRYEVQEDGSYELCADFHDAARLEKESRSPYRQWVNPDTGCVHAAYEPS